MERRHRHILNGLTPKKKTPTRCLQSTLATTAHCGGREWQVSCFSAGQPLPHRVNALPARSSFATSHLSRAALGPRSQPALVESPSCRRRLWMGWDEHGMGRKPRMGGGRKNTASLARPRIWRPKLQKRPAKGSPKAQRQAGERLVCRHSFTPRSPAATVLAEQGSWLFGLDLPPAHLFPVLASLRRGCPSTSRILAGRGMPPPALYVTTSLPIGRFPRRLVPERNSY